MPPGADGLKDALLAAKADAAAAGQVVELRLGSAIYYLGGRSSPGRRSASLGGGTGTGTRRTRRHRRQLQATAADEAATAGNALATFDSNAVASEIRLVGDGHTYLSVGDATLFVVLPGAPAITMVNLNFISSASAGSRDDVVASDDDDVATMAVYGGSGVTFDRCTFEANALPLLIRGGEVSVRRSHFTSNGGLHARGGAILADGDGFLSIDASSFDANTAEEGGAIYASGASTLSIRNTTFLRNNAHGAGGRAGGALRVAGSATVILREGTRLSRAAPDVNNTLLVTGTASRVAYVLPAPLGHWIANALTCNAQEASIDRICLRESLDVLENEMYSVLPRGALNDDYPFACAPGVFGESFDAAQQSTPQCSGACPSGFHCGGGTVVPVECPRGAFCATGSAAPVLCDDGTFGEVAGLSRRDECTICPSGSFCSRGERFDCAAGTFSPFTGSMQSTDCTSCPLYSNTTGPRATTIDECYCDEGFYDRRVLRKDSRLAELDCRECPVGANCSSPRITLATLPLQRGFFRLTNRSETLYACVDARTNCSSQLGSCPTSTSACFGGPHFPQACVNGTGGVFCLLCASSRQESASGGGASGAHQYYVAASGAETAHCKECTNSVGEGLSLLVGLAIAALAIGLLLLSCGCYVLYRVLPVCLSPAFAIELIVVWERYTLFNKGKIVFAFYLIATKVSDVYEVTPPDLAKHYLQWLDALTSFGIDVVQGTPLQCLGLGGFLPRLQFFFALPLALASLVLVAATAHLAFQRNLGRSQLFEASMPWMLRLVFLLYPLVTAVAFEAWACYDFPEEGISFLREDVSVQCDSPEHDRILGWAWASVILYVAGLWLFCAVLLFYLSSDIRLRRGLASKSISFLYSEYKPTLFWWELIEMLRRAMLVGFFRIIGPHPGSIAQIGGAVLFCTCYLVLQVQAAPFRSLSDGWVATGGSVSLLVLLIWAVFAKYAEISTRTRLTDDEQETFRFRFATELCIISVAGILLFTFGVLLRQIYDEREKQAKEDRASRARRLRHRKDNSEVTAPKVDSYEFHLLYPCWRSQTLDCILGRRILCSQASTVRLPLHGQPLARLGYWAGSDANRQASTARDDTRHTGARGSTALRAAVWLLCSMGMRSHDRATAYPRDCTGLPGRG